MEKEREKGRGAKHVFARVTSAKHVAREKRDVHRGLRFVWFIIIAQSSLRETSSLRDADQRDCPASVAVGPKVIPSRDKKLMHSSPLVVENRAAIVDRIPLTSKTWHLEIATQNLVALWAAIHVQSAFFVEAKSRRFAWSDLPWIFMNSFYIYREKYVRRELMRNGGRLEIIQTTQSLKSKKSL